MPANQSGPDSSTISESPELRVRENAPELPAFPDFGSLPAAAGLTNLEAFRLSLRHALSLLRAMPVSGAKWNQADEPERFSIR